MQFAGLEFQERWYWAQYQRSSRFEPHSVVTQLIQGVWDRYPAQAREILRTRIYTTEIVPVLDPEMVKVSAKRMSLVSEAEWNVMRGEVSEEITFHHLEMAGESLPQTQMSQAQAMDFLKQELSKRSAQTQQSLYFRDRAVGALILSSKGDVLSYSLNHNAVNRTLHAETLCVQSYWNRQHSPIPENSTLITTLSPCRQCAAMIEIASPMMKVVYLEKDFGKMARSKSVTHSVTNTRIESLNEEFVTKSVTK